MPAIEFAPEEIFYNPTAGRYQRADGKFVGRSVLRGMLDQEGQQLEAQLKADTKLMAEGKIPLAEWQLRMAGNLRDAHLRMGMLGSGGQERLGSRHYGAIGYQLRRQYEYLDGFARALYEGKLTEAQALRRAAQYADSINVTFHRTEQISREEEGFEEAKRDLDPQARHCTSCPAYSTRGEWVPISEIVPPGVNCQCGQHCRCQVSYRRRLVDPRTLNRGILAA